MNNTTPNRSARSHHCEDYRLGEDSPLYTAEATIGYDQATVSEGLNVVIPPDSFTVIVGPNGCGKSTLLHALARLLKPAAGSVVLHGQDIRSYGAKEVSRRIGLLPQNSLAPDGITVAELVSRGRYPHQGLLRQWTPEDAQAVAGALTATGLTDLSGKRVAELSGGQRQRTWIAVVLAQQTSLLLLDEPTTFLDIAHQVDLMELLTELHEEGRTLVAVLHDINQAARYATHMIAMKDGQVVAAGSPEQIVTEDMVRSVFGLECMVIEDPVAGTPAIIPKGRRGLG